MATSTLTAQGQVTIPLEIRERLGLAAGIRMRIEVDPEGKIVLVPDEPARESAGPADSFDKGLAGLVGLWDDGDEFVAEVEKVVANRTPPRLLNDIE